VLTICVHGPRRDRSGEETLIDTATLTTYILVVLGFVFIPGRATLLTVARATSSGTRVGIATGIGIAVGDIIHTAMAVFGISALIYASAFLFSLVKYAGAVYLVYLGIRAILARAPTGIVLRTGPRSASAAFRQAIIAEILNSKTASSSSLFFLNLFDPRTARCCCKWLSSG
jgi:threonine/homoserine/homoserine lactone efflux protein